MSVVCWLGGGGFLGGKAEGGTLRSSMLWCAGWGGGFLVG